MSDHPGRIAGGHDDGNVPAGVTDQLAALMREHVDALCAVGRDRHPGTERNRAATAYVASVLRGCGVNVEEIGFEVPDWRFGAARIEVDGLVLDAHPGPFSPGADGSGVLVSVARAADLAQLDTPGAVLLLHGEIARTQLTPRDYPWYSNPDDARILDALEAARPLAVVAATGKNPDFAAALSPFPLIDEPRFSVPSAYVSEETGTQLLEHAGAVARVVIESHTVPEVGIQVIGTTPGSVQGRVMIAAHVDTKPETPGALDNAAGVATLLGVAHLLRERPAALTVEYVPFNGEDHALSPGEVAYLAAHPDLSDIRLMVNVDDAGVAGAGPSACSIYGAPPAVESVVTEAMARFPAVVSGPQWPASDHMIFAMRGVPAIAITASDLSLVMGEITHTPADTPDLVDETLLADAARFIVEVVRGLSSERPAVGID